MISQDPRKPILPVSGWRPFPGYDIPEVFNHGNIFHYVVETMPYITIDGKIVTVNELECDDDGNFWVSRFSFAFKIKEVYLD